MTIRRSFKETEVDSMSASGRVTTAEERIIHVQALEHSAAIMDDAVPLWT